MEKEREDNLERGAYGQKMKTKEGKKKRKEGQMHFIRVVVPSDRPSIVSFLAILSATFPNTHGGKLVAT